MPDMSLDRMVLLSALVLALTFACPGMAEANEWKVVKDKDGIVVSTRDVEGRSFPQLRASGEVPGTPYEVLAILVDVPGHVYWRPDCVVSETVRRVDTWRSIVYSRTQAPWPVSDREVVLDNEVIFVEPPSKVTVAFSSLAAPDVENQSGTVRMPMATGAYVIEAVDETRSIVHYEVDADLGGNLPGWLVSRQSVKNPFETIAGLRRRLDQTRGQYDEIIALFPKAP